MKKLLIASIIGAGFVASSAHADTANLTVNASVIGKCKITTAPPTATVTIDPSVVGPYTATSTFAYQCTKSFTPTTFTAGGGSNFAGGSNQLKDASANLLKYTVTMPAAAAGNGFGAAAAISAIISVSVATVDGQAAPASATYTDTVLITVAP